MDITPTTIMQEVLDLPMQTLDHIQVELMEETTTITVEQTVSITVVIPEVITAELLIKERDPHLL